MVERVISRLSTLDYEANEKDKILIAYLVEKNRQSMTIDLTKTALPTELEYVLIERVVGDFLLNALRMNLLSKEAQERILKSVSMGDTSYTYEDKLTLEQQFTFLCETLLLSGESEMNSFRQLQW